jgi:protein arginine N-methyltransferase 1
MGARVRLQNGMYGLSDYLWMLADSRRVEAYSAAIAAIVRPGDHVIEIGAGIGYFSVVAIHAGAARVDAIEINPVGHIGARVMAANGLGDRVRVFCGDASDFAPDTRADVIIADLRGPTPFASRSLAVVLDARRRMLREGGAIIAAADHLWCAPVRQSRTFEREVMAPLTNGIVDLSPAQRVMFDTPMRCGIGVDELCAAPAPWGVIDYRTFTSPHHQGRAEWHFDRDDEVRGIAVWFEADLGAGVRFSTAPDQPRSVYSQLFIPLREPIVIRAGECLQAELAVHFANAEYVWAWSVRIINASGVRYRSSQNSIAAQVLDPAAHRPRV